MHRLGFPQLCANTNVVELLSRSPTGRNFEIGRLAIAWKTCFVRHRSLSKNRIALFLLHNDLSRSDVFLGRAAFDDKNKSTTEV